MTANILAEFPSCEQMIKVLGNFSQSIAMPFFFLFFL